MYHFLFCGYTLNKIKLFVSVNVAALSEKQVHILRFIFRIYPVLFESLVLVCQFGRLCQKLRETHAEINNENRCIQLRPIESTKWSYKFPRQFDRPTKRRYNHKQRKLR